MIFGDGFQRNKTKSSLHLFSSIPHFQFSIHMVIYGVYAIFNSPIFTIQISNHHKSRRKHDRLLSALPNSTGLQDQDTAAQSAGGKSTKYWLMAMEKPLLIVKIWKHRVNMEVSLENMGKSWIMMEHP